MRAGRPTRTGALLAAAALAAVAAGGAVAATVAAAPAAAAVSGDAAVGATAVVGAAVVEHPGRVAVGPEPDGAAVSLDVSVFTPPGDAGGAGSARHPAVILAHGFGGTKADLAAQARVLAAAGYVVLTYTARGFGASGGRIHLDAPAYEVTDAARLVDALAARPDVQLDAPGDPRVGIAGGSYGGGIALLAAGADRRIDAVVSALAWNDLSTALFPQAVQGAGAAAVGVFKQRWTALLFSSGSGSGATSGATGTGASGGGSASSPAAVETAAVCGRFDPTLCRLYLQTAQTGVVAPQLTALLRASSPARVLAHTRAPTLLEQGEQDSLFGLDQADANARAIAAAGVPVAVRWIAGGHDSLAGSTTDLAADGVAWFDRYLRGQRATASTPTGWTFAVPSTSSAALASAAAGGGGSGTSAGSGSTARRSSTPTASASAGTATAASGSGSGSGSGGARSQALAAQSATRDLHLPAYPGIDGHPATPRRTVALAGSAQDLQSPPGGVPAAITGLAGASAGLGVLDAAGLGGSLGILAGQSAVFPGTSTGGGYRITGAPTVTLAVTSTTTDATLFAGLWLVAPDGTETLPETLVAPFRLAGLTPGVARTVTVALPGIVTQVPAGDSLALVVSATDQDYAVPRDARGYRVALVGAGVSVPVAVGAVFVTAGTSAAPLSLVLAAAAVVLAAVVVALVTRLRGRSREHRADVDGPPLVVAGLHKTYGDRKVVDDVSWTAGRGQVVGLLGPNGAGKTTTMRMLVGLIRPDEGRVEVLGRRIEPGAPVLAHVGAFIEGPGFLPHLTGRANLDAFWAATGRPPEDAHLAEALEIAGLHGAVDRRVKGYSQGMRQRLGVAQAMLGLPDVLILDEPTNGLDPPQIQRMRTVLADYAATGRTVVVSSHLISEVEQTCSHVVVMRDGKVVVTGSVEDLVGAGNTVALDVDDAEGARHALADEPGVTGVDVLSPHRVVAHLDGTRRSAVVARLVDAGVAVNGASAQAHLEEVVLAAIGGAGVQ